MKSYYEKFVIKSKVLLNNKTADSKCCPSLKCLLLLSNRCYEGVIVPISQAIEMLSFFRSKNVLQRTTFRGWFEVSPFLKIPVHDMASPPLFYFMYSFWNNNEIDSIVICSLSLLLLLLFVFVLFVIVIILLLKVWAYKKTMETKFPLLKRVSKVSKEEGTRSFHQIQMHI
jgi:hypothetical protein